RRLGDPRRRAGSPWGAKADSPAAAGRTPASAPAVREVALEEALPSGPRREAAPALAAPLGPALAAVAGALATDPARQVAWAHTLFNALGAVLGALASYFSLHRYLKV
ncbi:MAG: hypothetical protein LOD90_09820, partial [Symbiobacteriaceae bacterium]